jgi:thiosulfate/3-mercaptopyruvate sulfurtransferase
MSDSLRDAHFIGAARLAELIGGGRRLAILDVGIGNTPEQALEPYDEAHIPGAVFVHLETDLQAPNGGAAGKRPLPDLLVLQAKARAWGISGGTTVVVYDRYAGTKAGRAWWVLRWAGLTDVRILDGGLEAWVRSDRSTTTRAVEPVPGDVTLRPDHLPRLTTGDAIELAASGRLFDARAPRQFAEGHIPGARLAPTRANLTDDGLLRDAAWIRERYAELGVDGTQGAGFYCGGAVAAAHGVAVLASIGVQVSLYVPSFGGWSADADNEVAVGDELEAAR